MGDLIELFTFLTSVRYARISQLAGYGHRESTQTMDYIDKSMQNILVNLKQKDIKQADYEIHKLKRYIKKGNPA